VAQKYVNSPDSDIYHKERELYGIFQAKKAIVKEDRVFMVEGYTDVIAMHQAGIENVVANSGTALSVYQIKMLRRFTQNITLLYDGDEAGIHAAMRGTDMLLEEGMNVKVLLLPDGDDPDSFARKHSTDELKRYIEENQQDFIGFKTRLTVEGVSDPVKRSEAISGIVKSISVIPDAILRSTYLSDLASRLGLKEQTLISSMNDLIRNSLTPNPSREGEGSNNTGGGNTVEKVSTPLSPARGGGGVALEHLLMREVVRHGEEIIYADVEMDDGSTTNFNVAQYIAYDLGQDGLTFSNPLYNQMLAEAVAHSGDEGFKAESYFMNHPDIEVSQTAARLAVDRHQLGGRFVLKPREGSLRQRIVHLIMDFRMDIVGQRLKEIQMAMRQATGDMERIMQLMEEYKDTQQLRDLLARRLGSDVMT
jgi:DNA primase